MKNNFSGLSSLNSFKINAIRDARFVAGFTLIKLLEGATMRGKACELRIIPRNKTSLTEDDPPSVFEFMHATQNLWRSNTPWQYSRPSLEVVVDDGDKKRAEIIEFLMTTDTLATLADVAQAVQSSELETQHHLDVLWGKGWTIYICRSGTWGFGLKRNDDNVY